MRKWIPVLAVHLLLMGSVPAQIAVNQVGYLPGAQKFAFLKSPAKTFSIIDVQTEKSVFDGEVAPWIADDPGTGHSVYRGDFSGFQVPGEYRIRSDRGETSCTFTVASDVYDALYVHALKTFYIQRCGTDVTAEFAGEFAHPACHLSEAAYHPDTGKEGSREVSGGWHDAGDYGRYIVNGAYSAAVMLLGYEYFPRAFQSDRIGIPESGNGVPDFLDEIRYELAWMLKMQDDDGGLFHKVTERAFQTLDLKPHLDANPQIITVKSTAATADFVTVMARAARVYHPHDAAFAQTCKNASVKAWDYLESRPAIAPQGGYLNPPDIHTGQYDDVDDRDERLWAAVELYHATGDPRFNRYFKTHWEELELFPGEIAWRDVAPFAIVSYLRFAPDSGNGGVKKQLQDALRGFCDNRLERRKQNGYHALLNPGDYRWGSLQIDLNFGFILLAGGYELGNETYKAAALDQMNYILGANGLHQSFVTGFGEKFPTRVHNRICSLSGDWDIFPGFLVGGPNENLEDPLLKEAFSDGTPPGLCYLDVRDSYASNETCINWNAILVVYAGYLQGMRSVSE